MKYVVVMAIIIKGQLSYETAGPYNRYADCLNVLHSLIALYVKDGIPMKDIGGNCYIQVPR